MAGVLLNSGSLQQYTAIGDEGQPVYSVASQLREAVRLKVGAQAADCLAIPRVNDARSSIDWYSTREGAVVPWSAATEQERADALRDLDQFHQQMCEAVARLGGVSDREKRIVQNLLTKVFHFPGQDCVFLVDGRPVLTFWGFQSGTAAPAQDPFYTLRPAPVAQARAPLPLAEVPSRATGRPWWLWLLLLLLLAALLLWLLRGCMQDPVVVPGSPPGGQLNEQVIKDPAIKPEVVPIADERGLIGGVQRWWQGVTGQVPAVADRVDATGKVIENTGVGVDAKGNPLPGAEVPVGPDAQTGDWVGTDPAGKDPAVGDPGAKDLNAKDPKALSPDAVGPDAKDPNAKDPNAKDPNAKDPNAKDPASLKPPDPADPARLPEKTPPAGVDPANKNLTSGAAGNDPAAALGTPMAIPQESLKSGSVKFLDGKWRAAGGLQDSQTGQPVRLQYQFDNGKAKVTVDRGGGVQCEGVASSSIVGGKLQISEQGALARCSDGSTFTLPQVTCTPDQSGRSQCTGQGQDGRSLPITIRQTP